MSLLTQGLIDLGELHNKRHAALVEADFSASQIEALERRVEAGTKKIWEAKQKGVAAAELDKADLRLHGLLDELHELRLRYEVPAEVIESFYTLARYLTGQGLPEGSQISAVIPGRLYLEVDVVDANEPPF